MRSASLVTLRLAVLAAFLFVWTVPAQAAVYQYFDEEGTLVVTDNPYHLKRPRAQQTARPRDLKLAYREDVSYDFYYVSANSIQDAIAAVRSNGPFNNRDNKTYAGETRWNMGWSYKFDSSSRIEGSSLYVSVNIYEMEFRSDIVVLLPALTENSALNPSDMQNWENFLKVLLEHEHDHVRIVKDPSYRDEAQTRIGAIREFVLPYDPAAGIDALVKSAVEAETARIGHDIIKKIKDRNDEYDRITEHGSKHFLRNSFFGG